MTQPTKTLSGQTIALTGKLSEINRKDAGVALEALGAKISSGVTAKTTLLIAGTNAGEKLTQANQRGVPILHEPHLRLLLRGDALADVLALATTFYTIRSSAEPTSPKTLNRRGGPAPGVSAARWPRVADDLMDHLFTLDLDDLPGLKLYLEPEARTLSVFAKLRPAPGQALSMYDMSRPSRWLTWVTSTQAQLDDSFEPVAGVPQTPSAYHQVIARAGHELSSHLARQRVLGGMPGWCQSEGYAKGYLLMQLGEESGISGDGLIYLFHDGISLAQFT